MQSATSFFNRSLFFGSLRRSWPLWFAYTLGWLLVLPLPLLIELSDTFRYDSSDAAYFFLERGAVGGVAMAVVFGIFFAMAMFAYLTNPRATQGFHTMPIRREGLYATNYLTGLFCLLSSLLVAFALAGVTAAAFGAPAFAELGRGLLAAMFAVVFFYSFGVFCMMFTGQILAAPVFYGILNVVAAGMELLVRGFAGNFLFGYYETYSELKLAVLSPVFKIVQEVDVSRVRELQSIDGVMQGIPTDQFELSGLGVLAAYAAAGIVFAVLGLLVYRRRASEATGSTVAVSWARPLFKYGMALCAAFSFGQLIYYLFFGVNLSQGEYSLAGTLVCMLFAGLLGYFAAEMLLQKSFRVWRSGRVGALVFSVVLMCFGVAMSLDLTGYEAYIPDLDEVESVRVNLDTHGTNIYMTLTEPESIALAMSAHRAIIADKERQLGTAAALDGEMTYLSYRALYTLADGRTVERRYYNCTAFAAETNDPDSLTYQFTALANCPEVVRKQIFGDLYNNDAYTFTGGYAYLHANDGDFSNSLELTAADARTLYAALERDYHAGHISDASLFYRADADADYTVSLDLWYIEKASPSQNAEKTVAEVYLHSYGSGVAYTVEDSGSLSFNLNVLPSMTYTMAELRALGLFDGAAW